ncbi:MAG: hypothetical protein RBS96_01015 [Dehalococcoidales bacterium]|nr:hypothetical protein [Dehalococcoidales bacterium]MDD5498113.1 hypothetical protein [Dehalococcoidales bacterium]MDX9802599.1 hypothetical protein [Dehalococcoidales bacterium]
MDDKTKNTLVLLTGALVVGGFVVSPVGRKIISRAKWRMMSAEKRYAYLWERTRQSLYSTPASSEA